MNNSEIHECGYSTVDDKGASFHGLFIETDNCEISNSLISDNFYTPTLQNSNFSKISNCTFKNNVQEIKAFISLKPEYKGKVTKDDLLEWWQSNISPYKYPRMIEIVPELPKSIIGKILRRELRKEGE